MNPNIIFHSENILYGKGKCDTLNELVNGLEVSKINFLLSAT